MIATTDITAQVTRLSDHSFQAFCDDIAGMFGVDMRCEHRQAALGTVPSLRESFKKLTAVHLIKAEGILNGTFYLVFDQGGLFVLSGMIVMLPEARIMEHIWRGSLQDAENLQDAAKEAGNLLVGSWNRVFREGCAGHKHFLKTGTFIGKPWDPPGQAELQAEGEALIVLYEMTIEPYPSFTCAAVFPTAVLDGVQGIAVAPPEEGPPKTPEGGHGAEAAGQKAQDSGPPARQSVAQAGEAGKTQDTGPKTENVGQKTEDRGQKTEDRGQKTEDNAVLRDPSSVLPDSASSPRLPDQALTALLRVPASEIMEKEVVWADPEDTVQDVIAKMQQHNVGYVLIGHNGVLEGLVSSSNILGAVSLYLRPMFAQWRRPEDDATLGVKVKWIMSRPVRTVRTDATLAAVIESMRRCGGRCLPVVDARGTVQGLVSVFDILLRIQQADQSFTWQGKPPQAPALLI